jgi:hypothetical protein
MVVVPAGGTGPAARERAALMIFWGEFRSGGGAA